MKAIWLTPMLACAGLAFGRITVTNNSTPATLASALQGSGISLSKPALSADPDATGLFSTGPLPNNYGLTGDGFVLSTGTATDFSSGSNLQSDHTTIFGPSATAGQVSLLSPSLLTSDIYDVAELSVDITVSTPRRIVFDVVFGSDEWPEYIPGYVDGVGVFVGASTFSFARTADGNVLSASNANFPSTAIAETELDNVAAPGGNPRVRFTAFVPTGVTTVKILNGDANDE